jgi:hypothetical protein
MDTAEPSPTGASSLVPETLAERMRAPRPKREHGPASRAVARLGEKPTVALMALIGLLIVALLVVIALLGHANRSVNEQLTRAKDDAASAQLVGAYDALVRTRDGHPPVGYDAVSDALRRAHPFTGITRSAPAVDEFKICSAAAGDLQVATRSQTGKTYTLTVSEDGSGYTISSRGCARAEPA